MLATIMRVYSYIYHLVIVLMMLALSAVVLVSGSTNVRLGMLPWAGSTLTTYLLWGGLAGLLIIVLAVTGVFRYLFPIWALLVLVIMFRGYILGGYSFAGRTEFYWVLLLLFGGLLALLGSLTVFRARPRRV